MKPRWVQVTESTCLLGLPLKCCMEKALETAVDGGALAKHREELDSYKGPELMTLAPLRAQEAVLQLVSSIAMLPVSKWHAPLYLILSGLKPGNYP